MDQKVLLLLVILALVGIAYYVRFKPRLPHGAATSAPATGPSASAARPPPRRR